MSLSKRLNDPQTAARFFAFLEYPRAKIRDYLRHELGVEDAEATKLTDGAIERHREREQDDDRLAERHERAIAAEFDMSRSTWG